MDILVADAIEGIKGQHDDGTLQGVLRLKLDQGELCPINIRDRGVNWLGGANTASFFNLHDYNDYQAGGVKLSMPAVAIGFSGQQSGFQFRGHGRRFAALITNTGSTVPSRFDVFVNRELTYSGDATIRYLGVGLPAQGVENAWSLPIADDLPDDGPHLVEIYAHWDQAAATQLTVVALLGEKRIYGDILPRRANLPQLPGLTLTTSAQALQSGGHKSVQEIHFSSTDTIAHTILLVEGTGGTTRPIAVPAASGSIPGFATVDYPTPVLTDSSWTVKLNEALNDGAKAVTCLSITGN